MKDLPADFLTPERCCLLVIDPQERLMPAIHQAERVIHNTVLMIHCAVALNIPILTTTQYRKGLGPFVPALYDLLAAAPCTDKTEFNAFANPAVREMLATLPASVDTFLLAGAEAHICIYQTAKGAMLAGYRTWVVADGISSRNKKNATLALRHMRSMGIAVAPAEMIIYELLHKAGTTAFKAMLPHLK